MLDTITDMFHAAAAARNTRRVSYIDAMVRVIYARIRYGIGPQFFSYYQMIDLPPNQWPEYDVERTLESLLKLVNPMDERAVVSDKWRFYRHCTENNLPTIPVIYCSSLAGREPVNCHEPTFTTALKDVSGGVFIKPISGAHGDNAFAAQKVNGVWHFEGKLGSVEDLRAYCTAKMHAERGWLVQPLIANHGDLKGLSVGNVLNTLRIITLLRGSEVLVPYALLKISAHETGPDNFNRGAGGNMVAAVDINSGILLTAAGSRTNSWPVIESMSFHPATEYKIEGMKLPFWQETLQTLIRAHKTLPSLRSLGWDVALTDGGPVVVEANPNYCGLILQAAVGRGLKSELRELLSTLAP